LNEEEDKAKEFIPIKIFSTWSKTMCIWYLTIADTTKVNDSKNQLLKNKVCHILSSKWEEDSSYFLIKIAFLMKFLVEPPFIESVTKYFTFKSLKNIVLRQKFDKPLNSPTSFNKTSQDDNLINHSLTREEKEKILNLFAMVELNIPLDQKKNSPGVLLRAKSPLRMEKFIDQNKFFFS